MKTSFITLVGLAAAVIAAVVSGGCGDVARQGRSPSQIVISLFEAASGATPTEFGSTLNSDVVTLVDQNVGGQQVRVPTIFNDLGRVTMTMVLKDPGVPGIAATPSLLNQITVTRYRVVYRRADGRNTPGVDVPFPFDSGVTFTIPLDGNVVVPFELVRHIAKQEAPLLALAASPTIISTIAEITFYGRDQAGNEVSATAMIGISFGNFGDPE